MENIKPYEYFKGMPPWAKGIIGVVVVGGVGLAIYGIYRGIKRAKDYNDANQAAVLADQELKKLHSKGINPTMDASQFEGYAQVLSEAMNGCGTNEEQVYDVFKKMNNQADVLMLVKTFAIRWYTPCIASNPVSYIYSAFNSKAFGGPLSQWLSYDMTASEIGKINTILQGKGITYKF